MLRIHRVALVVTAVVCGGAIGVVGQADFQSYRVADAPAEFRDAIQRGDLVIVSLHNAFRAELTRELRRGGPLGAIKSCHLDATNAAFQAAREQGLAAGRTSDRLRNPTNGPRPWAAAIVAQYAGHSARETGGVVVDLGSHVGLMRPIVHQAMCNACHGPEDGIDGKIRAELKERYPTDRALGFKDGDVRGWYWVEVPK